MDDFFSLLQRQALRMKPAIEEQLLELSGGKPFVLDVAGLNLRPAQSSEEEVGDWVFEVTWAVTGHEFVSDVTQSLDLELDCSDFHSARERVMGIIRDG